MKKRKAFLGIALLVAVLMLGVGYAAVTKQLDITGHAKADPNNANFVVNFTGVTVSDAAKVTAVVTGDKGLKATMNVSGLTTIGDTASATFTILNESADLKAALSKAKIDGDPTDYFEVTSTDLTDVVLEPVDGTTTVTVTVKLVKNPVETVNYDFMVYVDATAVEE